LCKGEDGHVAVEIVRGHCCRNPINDVSQKVSVVPVMERPTSKNDCGDCVDIPISVEFVTTMKESNLINQAVSALTAGILTNTYNYDFSEYQTVSESFNPIGYFTPLRSIIILI
jgi:hypothetical protein